MLTRTAPSNSRIKLSAFSRSGDNYLDLPCCSINRQRRTRMSSNIASMLASCINTKHASTFCSLLSSAFVLLSNVRAYVKATLFRLSTKPRSKIQHQRLGRKSRCISEECPGTFMGREWKSYAASLCPSWSCWS